MPDEQWPQIQPGKPACYRIAVMGRVDEHWSGRLGGMQIASEQQDDQPITIMTGQVKDQADLIGVLNTLYQIRTQILSVNCEPCHEPEANH
ncbi:hypothetical protein CA13_27210 [Planctomycetes bacterium CA13]|uniref:Uncharacterized protein n=1 Tax=Novipirellula herctigrandis TaxID=2527986 RepID=A0A5C5Z262_9BACT|nr:hypothetical protein CA13_27210 [Planctomycetes bacterium CA13]